MQGSTGTPGEGSPDSPPGGRPGGEADWPGRGLLHDLAGCLRFYSRLPVPRLPGEADPHARPDFARLPRMLPLAGLILALPAAGVLAAAFRLGLGPYLAATLAVAAAVAVTGALHEDGLADVADGFGGGHDRAGRLAIMRDSRIGTYGGAALVLALGLRIGALATLLDRVALAAVPALLLAAVLSRVAALAPLVLLAPARADGLSAAVGRPAPGSVGLALGSAGLLALAAIPAGLPPAGIGLMATMTVLAALAVTRLARRMIGGQTGDVVGAAQQAAEIAALLALVAGTSGQP